LSESKKKYAHVEETDLKMETPMCGVFNLNVIINGAKVPWLSNVSLAKLLCLYSVAKAIVKIEITLDREKLGIEKEELKE